MPRVPEPSASTWSTCGGSCYSHSNTKGSQRHHPRNASNAARRSLHGHLTYCQAEYESAEALIGQARALAQRLGDSGGLAMACQLLGNIARQALRVAEMCAGCVGMSGKTLVTLAAGSSRG